MNQGARGLLAALQRLPAAAAEQEILQALPRIACQELGWGAARIWGQETPRVLAQWPERDEFPHAYLVSAQVTGACQLEAAGHADPDDLAALAVVAGRLIEEARARARLVQRTERLARRAREMEERHRSLSLRLTELRGELDTTQQEHVVLSERNRIAQDLHDRAAQTNFLVALKLDWALAHLQEDSPLRGELERLKELAAQAAAQTREAIYALRAPEMADGGLMAGLRKLVRSMETDGFTANLTVTGAPVLLGTEVEDALFKLVQEALNNARKHSRGTAVMVAVRFTPGHVALVVQDDGVGMPETVPEGRLGLRGMRERVIALNGQFAVLGGDEGGLIVRATIPIGKGS